MCVCMCVYTYNIYLYTFNVLRLLDLRFFALFPFSSFTDGFSLPKSL